jgi:hypothetical protein
LHRWRWRGTAIVEAQRKEQWSPVIGGLSVLLRKLPLHSNINPPVNPAMAQPLCRCSLLVFRDLIPIRGENVPSAPWASSCQHLAVEFLALVWCRLQCQRNRGADNSLTGFEFVYQVKHPVNFDPSTACNPLQTRAFEREDFWISSLKGSH